MNNFDIDYYIICHNQDIILSMSQQTIDFPYRWIFVGQEDYSKISNLNNVIISNNLLYNIEHMPMLCSFTGWYAVALNRLFSSNIICLLEYDTKPAKLFNLYNHIITTNQINDNYIISYCNTFTNHYVFYKSTPWLEISLKKIYNIDLMDFLLCHKNCHPFWPTTTNITMPHHILSSFVDWFYPMVQLFHHHPLGAYVHERAFFVYCVLNNIKIIYAQPNLLQHYQSRSHKIHDIYGNFLTSKNTNILQYNMLAEYDQVYKNSTEDCLLSLKKYQSTEYHNT